MSLVELFIWFVIVLLPWLALFGLLYWVGKKLGWRMRRQPVAAPAPPPAPTSPPDED